MKSGPRSGYPEPWINMSDAFNRERFESDFNYLNETFFTHPQYLKMNEKSVMFFDMLRNFFGNLDIVKKVKEKYNVYIVGDVLHLFEYGHADEESFLSELIKIIDVCDGISGPGFWPYSHPKVVGEKDRLFSYLEEVYVNLLQMLKDKDLVPLAMPGVESDPDVISDPAYLPLKREKEVLLKYLDLCKKICYTQYVPHCEF